MKIINLFTFYFLFSCSILKIESANEIYTFHDKDLIFQVKIDKKYLSKDEDSIKIEITLENKTNDTIIVLKNFPQYSLNEKEQSIWINWGYEFYSGLTIEISCEIIPQEKEYKTIWLIPLNKFQNELENNGTVTIFFDIGFLEKNKMRSIQHYPNYKYEINPIVNGNEMVLGSIDFDFLSTKKQLFGLRLNYK